MKDFWQRALKKNDTLQTGTFGDLPETFQKAVKHYNKEWVSWGFSDAIENDTPWQFGVLPPEVFQAVMDEVHPEMLDYYEPQTFEGYLGDKTKPSHIPQTDDPWPVMVSDHVGIDDGWNRIITYMARGIDIPVVIW